MIGAAGARRAEAAAPGRRLAALRRARAWTQSRLARALGVSRRRLSDLERGRARPEAGLLARAGLVLGAPPEYFPAGAAEAAGTAGAAGEDDPMGSIFRPEVVALLRREPVSHFLASLLAGALVAVIDTLAEAAPLLAAAGAGRRRGDLAPGRPESGEGHGP